VKKSAVTHGPANLLYCSGHHRGSLILRQAQDEVDFAGRCHESCIFMLSLSKHDDRSCNRSTKAARRFLHKLESRDPPRRIVLVEKWIPDFAGMTRGAFRDSPIPIEAGGVLDHDGRPSLAPALERP